MSRMTMINREKGSANKTLIVAAVCIGALALLAVLFWTSGGGQQPPAPDAAQQPFVPEGQVPAEPAPRVITGPYAHSPYAANIEDGLNFAAEHQKHHVADYQIWAILHYLYRKFDLDEKYAIANTAKMGSLNKNHKEMAEMFMRLAEPGHRVAAETIDAIPIPIVQQMARALYCDAYPVDQAFVEEVLKQLDYEDENTGLAGYIRSHAILCCQWMIENGCAAAFPEIDAARKRFPEILGAIIEQEKGVTDLAFEAMAFLHYTGFGELVKDEWVAQLAEQQKPGGGWSYGPGRDDADIPDGHPTILAAWVLLEHALPDAPDIPWIGMAGNPAASANALEN